MKIFSITYRRQLFYCLFMIFLAFFAPFRTFELGLRDLYFDIQVPSYLTLTDKNERNCQIPSLNYCYCVIKDSFIFFQVFKTITLPVWINRAWMPFIHQWWNTRMKSARSLTGSPNLSARRLIKAVDCAGREKTVGMKEANMVEKLRPYTCQCNIIKNIKYGLSALEIHHNFFVEACSDS